MRITAAPLRLTTEPLEEACLIRAAGEIDVSNVIVLRGELESARKANATTLLDLSQVRFIDSAGLRLLLESSRHSELADWPFFIVRPSANVQRLIEVSRTADQLTLVGSTAERILAG